MNETKPPQAKPPQGTVQGLVNGAEPPPGAPLPAAAGPIASARDPSMEDILASIRRILSEDEGGAHLPHPPAPTPAPAHGTDDVLDLDLGMMVQEPMVQEPTAQEPAPMHPDTIAQADQAPVQSEAHPHEAPPPIQPVASHQPEAAGAPTHAPGPAPTPAPTAIPEGRVTGTEATGFAPPASIEQTPLDAPFETPMGLVAPEAAAAAAVSLGTLTRTLAAERQSAVHRGGPTIEDLVRENLRPLLKDWLDAHLPALVERLVRAEIERVVNRAAG